jgi:hypothetical protein
VPGQYIYECPGADQYLGRCATGLKMMGPELGCLPPHFNKGLTIALETEVLSEILPMYRYMPRSFIGTLKYLLASVCYHIKWLESNLDSNSPFFESLLYTSGVLENENGILKFLEGPSSISNPSSQMVATGVPVHVQQSVENKELAKQLNKVTEATTTMANTLDSFMQEFRGGSNRSNRGHLGNRSASKEKVTVSMSTSRGIVVVHERTEDDVTMIDSADIDDAMAVENSTPAGIEPEVGMEVETEPNAGDNTALDIQQWDRVNLFQPVTFKG